MKFWEIICDAYYENEQTIEDYELGDFDYYTFLDGKEYKGRIPEFVKLYIRKGDEKLPQASLVGGPLSWLIFSDRLLNFLWPLIKDDVQVFDAPVFLKDGTKVEGYKLINPICVLDCIDWERTEVSRYDDGSIAYCQKIFIKDHCVGKHHIFRLKGYLYTLIVSDKLAKSLAGKGFKGIAFIKCGVSPSTSVKIV